MIDNRRMVSCISGNESHLFYVVPKSAADVACPGQHISQAQCPQCVQEHRAELRREAEFCECEFDPNAELCKDGCTYLKEAQQLADAPKGLEMYIPAACDLLDEAIAR